MYLLENISDTIWPYYYFIYLFIFFFLIRRNCKISPKIFEEYKQISILNSKKYIKIFEKIITLLAYFDSSFIRYKYFACKLYYGTAIREKFNNLILLEFYKNYLPRIKYFWLHNIYSPFRNMYLYIPTWSYFQE